MALKVIKGGRGQEKTDNKKAGQCYRNQRYDGHHGAGEWDMWAQLEAWIGNKARNTQIKYRRTLDSFLELLEISRNEEGARRLQTINAGDVARYLAWVRSRPAQPGRPSLVGDKVSLSTVRNKVEVMNSIFEQLIAQESITHNPWKRSLRELRGVQGNDRRPHRAIPEDKIREIFALDYDPGAVGYRDRAMLAALFGGALRPSEMLALRCGDVRTSPKGAVALLLRNTKRQRAEIQVLPNWAGEIVRKYADVRKIEGADDKAFLFVHYLGGRPTADPIPDRTYRRQFKQILKRVRLPGDYSPHDARVSAITRLRKLGLSYEEIAPFSRHSSIAMVKHYDKLSGCEGEQAAEKLEF